MKKQAPFSDPGDSFAHFRADNEQSADVEDESFDHRVHPTDLNPMKWAPRDGSEILAFHEAGNFHPVYWKTWNVRKPHWGMRFNDAYSQRDVHFEGWVPYPVIER